MKTTLLYLSVLVIVTSCQHVKSKDELKNEILQTEKAFQKMTVEKGIAEAFHFFADSAAVINRGNDSLITGKENILVYYTRKKLDHATVTWTPDFVEVSECGTLAWTYGKYTWKTTDKEGKPVEYKGVFHTVWKRQKDGSWKYVWD